MTQSESDLKSSSTPITSPSSNPGDGPKTSTLPWKEPTTTPVSARETNPALPVNMPVPSRKRGRPRSDTNRIRRLRAFELYAGGGKKSEIAKTLGVTKASVGAWAKNDTWDERLTSLAARAQEAADHVLGETIADVVTKVRAKYDQRLRELDLICISALTPPNAKISAIRAWFDLGQNVFPDAMRPASDPRNLELIQDLLPAQEAQQRPGPLPPQEPSRREGLIPQESPTVGGQPPPTSG